MLVDGHVLHIPGPATRSPTSPPRSTGTDSAAGRRWTCGGCSRRPRSRRRTWNSCTASPGRSPQRCGTVKRRLSRPAALASGPARARSCCCSHPHSTCGPRPRRPRSTCGCSSRRTRLLIPPDAAAQAPVPAGACNVGAQLLAREAGVDGNPPLARVHLGSGHWLTLRAARMDSAQAVPERDIAVSIETTAPGGRVSLFARACGLSFREAELLGMSSPVRAPGTSPG
jgi:hypothetical protein